MSGPQSSAAARDPRQPPSRRRPPPRLRTKTGCLTCRKRRKKCDEHKPCCHTCERLALDCCWEDPLLPIRDRRLSCPPATPSAQPSAPSTPSTPSTPSGDVPRCPDDPCIVQTSSPAGHPPAAFPSDSWAVVPIRSPSPPKLLSGLSPFSSAHDESLFVFFNSHVLPSLARRHVDPVYQDQTTLCCIAYTCPWVMNALLSLSSHHLSWLRTRNGDPAVPYYAKAVRDLRRNMTSMSANDDSLLVAITFLGLYEELRSDEFSDAMVHFKTSSRILRTRMSDLVKSCATSSQMVFLRMHAESAMYHLSTRAMFLEQLPTEREWAQLQLYLQMRPAPGAAEWSESPLLGSIPRLFTLILETTRLSRTVPLNEALMKKAQNCFDEIQKARIRLEHLKAKALAEQSDHEPTLELEIDCIPRLYILALEIFLLKIMGPLTTRSNSPEVQTRVEEAHTLFFTAPFQEVHDHMRPGPNPAAYRYIEKYLSQSLEGPIQWIREESHSSRSSWLQCQCKAPQGQKSLFSIC
ncbi:hypothetical protein MPH_01921 [Macrophomina phaseolina MS6]|uniref:Zn(2)-C6 fungal-type domain-containing protein n=1 Tax=Macrophomina phaseolina (strain MS6) TaxID=1126212 RepID=K2SE92_MACPH|nr:hypothetical protein MPH_01921 [Macrophomina phaseolina MS6]